MQLHDTSSCSAEKSSSSPYIVPFSFSFSFFFFYPMISCQNHLWIPSIGMTIYNQKSKYCTKLLLHNTRGNFGMYFIFLVFFDGCFQSVRLENVKKLMPLKLCTVQYKFFHDFTDTYRI